MDTVKITLAERDILRNDLCCQGSAFEALQGYVEGGHETAEAYELMDRATMTALLFNHIGWEMKGDQESYEIPMTPGLSDYLAAARRLSLQAIDNGESVDPEYAMEVIAMYTGMLSGVEPAMVV